MHQMCVLVRLTAFFLLLQNLLGGFYIVETKTVFYSRTVVQIGLRGITHLLKAL